MTEFDTEAQDIARVAHLMGMDTNRIFVFGSNLAGRHGAGAAKHARWLYGATPGQGEGLSRKSYALPTKDYDLNTLVLPVIQVYVERLCRFAHLAPRLEFVVSRVGCNRAGYTDEDMAPLFKDAPRNLLLPRGWREFNGEAPE